MEHKILFVDDDRSLLNGVERRLGFDYDLDTAESGAEGLECLKAKGPYSVVFTDMRMPKMDGVQFLENAHAMSTDSVYIMLTGNSDQMTAMRALNEGHVFRFLSKPCESADLKRAIEDGIRQYELVRSEKELLQKTFVGAVRAFSEVVEVCHPELAGRTASIEEKVELLRKAAGIDDRWEYRLAGRLALLGVVLLPEADLRQFDRFDPGSTEIQELMNRSSAISKRLLSGIPRLDGIATICGCTDELTGSFSSTKPKTPGSVTQVGATLLRIATHWDFLSRQGLCASRLVQEMKELFPDAPAVIFEAIADVDDGDERAEGVRVRPGGLAEGMVTASDVYDATGSLLVRRGQRLTGASIEKLRAHGDVASIAVTDVTARAD